MPEGKLHFGDTRASFSGEIDRTHFFVPHNVTVNLRHRDPISQRGRGAHIGRLSFLGHGLLFCRRDYFFMEEGCLIARGALGGAHVARRTRKVAHARKRRWAGTKRKWAGPSTLCPYLGPRPPNPHPPSPKTQGCP